MNKFGRYLKRTAITIYLVGLHVLLVFLLVDRYILRNLFLENWTPPNISSSETEATPVPTPKPESTPVPLPTEPPERGALPTTINLIVPVQGVSRDKLVDTFSDA